MPAPPTGGRSEAGAVITSMVPTVRFVSAKRRLRRAVAGVTATALVSSGVLVAIGAVGPDQLDAAVGPVTPEHLTLTQGDLEFILDQVLIAESHANRTRTSTG